MATLSQTTTNARKIVIALLVIALLIIAGDTLIKYINSQYNPFNNTLSFYLEPDSGLGAIAKPDIPTLAIQDGSNPVFSVDGAFPTNSPDSVVAYSIEAPRTKFNTVEDAVRSAAALGYKTAYTETDAETLQWQNESRTRTLKFNKLTQAWSLRTQYFQDAVAQKVHVLEQNTNAYASRLRALILTIGFGSDSLSSGETSVVFARLGVDGLFSKPLNQASANYVVTDQYRKLDVAVVKDLALLTEAQRAVTQKPESLVGKVYTADPRQGSLRVVMSDEVQTLAEDIYEITFTNFPYTGRYGIYPAITAQEAWDRVRNGEGALRLAQLQTDDYFGNSRVLSVKRFAVDAARTELGFYEPDKWTGFLYPIYIFRGRIETSDGKIGNFVFYVDAIRRFN